MNRSRIEEIVACFPNARIAVVGDFFLDRYWTVDPSRDEPSVETGLTAYQVVERRIAPGAAGTVANNLAALGTGTVHAVGFVGEDGEGSELERALDAIGVNRTHLHPTPLRCTPCYTKPMRDGVEMNRIDIKNRTPTPEAVETRILDSIRSLLDRVDAIILMDQVSEPNCGVLTDRVRENLIAWGGERKNPDSRPILYADSRERISLYRAMLVKCNEREALEAFGKYEGHVPEESVLYECGTRLALRTGRPVFITLGERGQWIVEPPDGTLRGGPDSVRVPAVRVEGEIDICGAGDATSAALVASLCVGANLEEAAMIGNLAASVTIRKLGQTGTASPAEILAAWESHVASSRDLARTVG